VRDPQTGKGSREVALYREAVERIRASDVDVVVNTTAGMGGDLMLDPLNPTDFVEGTDLVSGVERLKHVEERLIDAPPMFQLCMDIPYGAPADPALLVAMVEQLPDNAVWASFALGRMQMPWVAQCVLLGGHVRVGLEDNLYLSKGVKATNAQLVERARTIIEAMGAEVATPDEGREILSLEPRVA
jgi:uncharacterized protein (DUF849 family)